LSIALFTVAPGARRDDLALFVIASALGVELLQGLTGRSVSVMDFLAGAAGVAAAWAPGRIEDLRFEARRHPDRTFAEIAARGRRGNDTRLTGQGSSGSTGIPGPKRRVIGLRRR